MQQMQLLPGHWRTLIWTVMMAWKAVKDTKTAAAEIRSGDEGSRDFSTRSKLKITTIEVEPYLMVARRSVNSTSSTWSNLDPESYYGYLPDLLEALSTTLNFEYDLYMVPDGSYGYRKSAGKWSGLIGELLKGKADLAAGPLLMTDNRREVVDFTIPFLTTHATLLLRRPPTGTELRIKTLDDLINQSEVKYGTLRKGIIPRSFRRTNDTVLRIAWRNMIRFGSSVFTSTNEEGIERVRRDKFAFVLPDTIGEYISMRQPCDFVTVGSFLLKKGYGLALQKNSPYLEQFDRGLKTLRKTGFLNRLKNRWWSGRSECNGIRTGKVYSLNRADDVITSGTFVSSVLSFTTFSVLSITVPYSFN